MRVNFFKSEIIGVRVNEDRQVMFADPFGCKSGSIPSSYLGLHLCLGLASKPLSQSVLGRMEKRVSLSKANYLSLGGIITLIKAVLANLLIYFLLLLKRPMDVINQIEKSQWNFLRNGREKNKFHLVKWLQVCKRVVWVLYH